MSEHGRVRAWLQAYVDGALPDGRRASLERHLAECPRCADAVRRAEASVHALEAGRAEPSPLPEASIERVRLAVLAAARPEGLSRRWQRLALAGAGAAATVAAILLLSWGSRAPAPSVGTPSGPGVGRERMASAAGSPRLGRGGEERTSPNPSFARRGVPGSPSIGRRPAPGRLRLAKRDAADGARRVRREAVDATPRLASGRSGAAGRLAGGPDGVAVPAEAPESVLVVTASGVPEPPDEMGVQVRASRGTEAQASYARAAALVPDGQGGATWRESAAESGAASATETTSAVRLDAGGREVAALRVAARMGERLEPRGGER